MASVNDSHCRCTSVLVLCSSETLDPVMTSIASEQIASIFHQSIQNTGANDLPYEGMSKQVTRGVTSLLAGISANNGHSRLTASLTIDSFP